MVTCEPQAGNQAWHGSEPRAFATYALDPDLPQVRHDDGILDALRSGADGSLEKPTPDTTSLTPSSGSQAASITSVRTVANRIRTCLRAVNCHRAALWF